MEEDRHVFEDGDALDELSAGIPRWNTTMLRVLCILTWTYCFFSVCAYVVFLGNANNFKELFNVGHNSSTLLVLNYVVLPIICAVGAIFMYRLNKWGFVVYLFGQLPPIIYSFYMAMVVAHISGPSLIFVVISNLFPVGFIILYLSQLHVMKPMFENRNSSQP